MLRRSAWVFSVLGLLLVAGCANGSNSANPGNPSNSSNPSNPSHKPSCLPPGYRPRAAGESKRLSEVEDTGEELDVMLAVVEGEVITKRRLARESGGQAGQDPEQFEREIRRLLKSKAQRMLFIKEAQRLGLTVRDSWLDKVVEEELEKQVKSASETAGRPVTVEELLADRGLTYEEYRNQVKDQLQQQLLVMRLREGLGQSIRPTVDMEVSPAEVRRIYWNHPRAFDEPAGARFVMFRLLVDDYLVDDSISFLDAEEKMLQDAEAVAKAFKAGTPAARIAERFHIGDAQWKEPKKDEFAPEGGPVTSLGPDVNAWLFDQARKKGDTTTVPGPGGDYVVLGFLEGRAGRRVPYEEAYPIVVKVIREIRTQRLLMEKLVEILSTRNAVQPPALAAEMLRDARAEIRRIDQDPVAASARFR